MVGRIQQLGDTLGIILQEEFLNPALVNHDRQHYQRSPIGARVDLKRKIIRKEVEKSVETNVVVARRPDGSLWSINGQHECLAAILEDINFLAMMTFTSLGWEQEKVIFDKFNAMQLAERTGAIK